MHAPEDGLGRQTVPALPEVPGAEHRVDFGLLPWETRALTGLDEPRASHHELGSPRLAVVHDPPELLDGFFPAVEMRQRDAEREPQLEVARLPVERRLVPGRRARPVVTPRELIAFLLQRADGRPHGRSQRIGRP